jgi:hypothetical protein
MTLPDIGNCLVDPPLASYLEVVLAAKNGEYFEDLKAGGRLATEIAVGYSAIMVAFSNLERQGFVKLEAGRLVLGALSPSDWLQDAIINGDPEAWAICDIYPARARKFQPDKISLEQIGKEGEEFVLTWLQERLNPQLHSTIVQTSLTDDSAGYDVRYVSDAGRRIFLEIKTTTREGDVFTFHLSRNEWHTARRLPNWHLILVNKIRGKFSFFGHLDGKSLVGYYPTDVHRDFRWTSVEGRFDQDDIYPGEPYQCL